jgi:hypothetical protein
LTNIEAFLAIFFNDRSLQNASKERDFLGETWLFFIQSEKKEHFLLDKIA